MKKKTSSFNVTGTQRPSRSTFSTLQLRARSVGGVVGRVALQAVVGARAEPAVVGAGLTGHLLGVVEGFGTGVHTQAFIEITLQSEPICRSRNR